MQAPDVAEPLLVRGADVAGETQLDTAGPARAPHLTLTDAAFGAEPAAVVEEPAGDLAAADAHLAIVEGDDELTARLMPEGYRARPERVFVFEVRAWDVNCQKHIEPKFDLDIVEQATDKLTRRIALLEAEVARLKGEAQPS